MSRSIKYYLLTLFFAAGSALFVRNFLITAYRVPTGSMQPALRPGDFIFASQKSFINRLKVQRGQIVVFSYPNQPQTKYVKRVIALSGDQIEIKAGRLIINKTPLEYSQPLKSHALDSNPNPDVFDILIEAFDGAHRWEILTEKNSVSKDFGLLVVPEGEAFLLGDNRDASDDSRYWGTVPIDQITGRVNFIWLSIDWSKKSENETLPGLRWDRVFSLVR
jgi:signal peptidase I